MIGLIVTGHGHFATGLTTSLNLIAGDAKEYVAVDFESTDSTDDLAKKLTDAMDSLKDCEGIGQRNISIAIKHSYTAHQ